MYDLEDILFYKSRVNLTKIGLTICLILMWPVVYSLYFVTVKEPNFHIQTLFKAGIVGLIFMSVICLYNFLRYGLKYLSFKRKTLTDRTALYYTYRILSEYLKAAEKDEGYPHPKEAEEIMEMSLNAFRDFEYDLEKDIANLRSDDPYENEVATFSLYLHAYDNISRLILEMQKENDKDTKKLLINIVGMSGSRVAVKPLIKELDNPDEDIRDAAVEVLVLSKFSEAADAVKEYREKHRPPLPGQ